VWDSGPFGPACSVSLRRQRGARGPASPQKDNCVLTSCLPLCAFGCFPRWPCHRERLEQGCAGGFPQLGRCPYLFLWAGVTRRFMRQEL